ncbi:uncharacterized protein [Rutidosis leptorrhynchoides]|uniref:uncharacterized protein n=1 Tax=Rutidosis leptorrhynchoides TaxID=125765 RepID=UPI003A99BD5F
MYIKGQSAVESVDRSLVAIMEALAILKYHFDRAQARIKHYADKGRTYKEFEVIDRIGVVVYKLELPATSQVHPVFHISQLKMHKGLDPVMMGVMPAMDHTLMITAVPIKILDQKIAERGSVAGVYWLIQWSGGSIDDATWELAEELIKRFPEFQYEGVDS